MARIEILNELFFPQAVRADGHIVPAQQPAVEKYMELRDGWLKDHPQLPREIPMVSMSPGKNNGRDGYFVRTEIMYRG